MQLRPALSLSHPALRRGAAAHGSGSLASQPMLEARSPMSSETLLSVQGLTKQFQTRSGTVKAVDGVSFDVQRGTIVGLVGESGSGKTTAGRCTLRLVEPNEGRIVFDGVDLRTLSEREMRNYRSRLQIIFQDPYSDRKSVV